MAIVRPISKDSANGAFRGYAPNGRNNLSESSWLKSTRFSLTGTMSYGQPIDFVQCRDDRFTRSVHGAIFFA